MKSLDSFTVEQLTEFIESDHAQCGDIAALARIALAAKRAKAAATADNERLKRVIEEAQKEIDSMQETIDYVHRRRVMWKDRYLFAEKKIKEIMTVDTTPRLNSLEIPWGWIRCSDRMPEVGDVVITAYQGCTNVGQMERSGKTYRYFTSIASGRELPATHWMPLPAAPEKPL
ncbi:DUF551 domain-containing protein [Yersinia pseudotuberculosis]|uniref:DUF551 domain-containing protein n=1 Tax=Yersinia pseudotuberculosis TaxID=633 RepID=UPI0005E07B09|nr:DUF551 domain-containing protein [Yersinia pseudotuberculosis]CFV22096.1 Protein of uncharacterised function (DUF551) [Yersinia pseudotuberculosis]